MKIFNTFLIILSLSISVFSQQKILFDATKAETANNADWIIDADNWNLGYNPDAYIGGNEANSQRYPTPDQSGITSTTNENYWYGAISAWAVDAVKKGFIVETLSYNGQITYGNTSNMQDLSNYKIFVVCEPNILFSSSEKTAMMNFVLDGGGLFMISDHNNSDRNGDGDDSPHIWNDFMQNNSVQNNPFGITFDYEYFDEFTENIPNLPSDPLLHGEMGDVTRVEFYGGTSITINTSNNPSVKAVVYKEGSSTTGNINSLCAYATYGTGKVVALGDSSPADDGTGDSGDNLYDGWILDANGNHERLIMNATIWLAKVENSVIKVPYNNDNAVVYTYNKNITIKINSSITREKFKFELFDLSGRIIISKIGLSPNILHEINLNKSGAFLYKISKGNNIYKSGKIIL